MSFLGYERPDGSAGIRNHVLVLPGGFLAAKICELVPGTKTIVTADSGNGRTKADRETIARTLIGLGRNPNVASVIVLTSSPTAAYAELKPTRLAEEIAASGKRVELIDVAAQGGTFRALETGVQCAREMVRDASKLRRRPFDLSHLSIGVKCGMSDATSGLAGNPAVGQLFDRITAAGGTAFFGETTEIIGAEHMLARRGANAEVNQAILQTVLDTERRAKATGEDIRTINPVPANIAGGISSLEEKSLGAIQKSGTSTIQGVLQYAERPPGKGLYFVDSWMSMFSIYPGFAAAGAQLMLFQLGGGVWGGNDILFPSPAVVSPLMWVTASAKAWAAGQHSIEFYSGTILEGEETSEEVGERLLATVLDIASGTLTKVETLNHTDPIQVYLKDTPF